jgi:hypothetical protein
MYSDTEEIRDERARRKREGIPTLRWYRCHNCEAEYPFSAGVRNSVGCSNPACANPDIHIHSDLDGEKPLTL